VDIEQPLITHNGELLFVRGIKVPIFNQHGEVMGVIGAPSSRISKRLTLERLSLLTPDIVCRLLKEDKKSYLIYYPNKTISITPIEALSLLFYIQNYPIKLISKFISRSEKTIDNYAARIKKQLDCKHKHELVKEIIRGGFLDNFGSVKTGSFSVNIYV